MSDESQVVTGGVGSPVGAVYGSAHGGSAANPGEPWPATPPAEPVLDEPSKQRIAELLTRYPDSKAVLIPALHIVQRRCGGWLPDYALDALAEHLEIDPAEVFGVVTFYDLFHQKPVGRHRIRVCTNLSCQLRGSAEIMEVLGEELGVGEDEVTDDGRCSYTHFECLGSCDTAPMMMVNDTYHENLTPQSVRSLLQEILSQERE